MRLIALAAAALLSGCVSVNANITEADGVLDAVRGARVRECPAERVREGAFTSGEPQSVGLTSVDLALTPLASDPTRALRLRRLTLAPGGAIAWHDHAAIQGAAILLSGQLVERRNSCLDPITYNAGDVVREDAATAHSWRNETDEEAVILVAHVVVR